MLIRTAVKVGWDETLSCSISRNLILRKCYFRDLLTFLAGLFLCRGQGIVRKLTSFKTVISFQGLGVLELGLVTA